jgi:glycosyltransferase involved in cell wall biosynthesis
VKVALLGPAHPYRGGIAHYTASLYRAIESAGHPVRLYNFTRQYPGFLFPGVTQTDQSEQAITVPSLRCVDTLNPATWISTAVRIGRYQPDLLVVQWWHPYFSPSYGTIARLSRRFGKSKVVILCHNVLPHEATVLDKRLLRFAYGSAEAFVVQAPREEALLRPLLRREVHVEVVPHPRYDVFAEDAVEIEPSVARETLGIKGDRVILFFGYIRPYKGLSVLIQAMSQLENQDIKLIIAGECYSDKRSYVNQLEVLGLTDRVYFFDRYIANEEVPTFFAAADVAVLPYLTATQSGVAQLAFALGVPVIVSAVGGIPDVVEDGETGLLVPPDHPELLAAAIDRFYDDDLEQTLRDAVKRQGAGGWDSLVDALARCLGG